LAFPSGKTQFIIDLCKKILEQEVSSLREVAAVMDNFTWAISAIPFAQAHYRIFLHNSSAEGGI
jgi:hypothetical protein